MIGETLWSLKTLISQCPKLKVIERVQPDRPLDEIVHKVEQKGVPLVMENYHRDSAWKDKLLSISWTENYWRESASAPELFIRNVDSFVDKKTTMSEYLEECRQWRSQNPSSKGQEKWYAKDMTCPSEWIDWLKDGNVIPRELLFFDKSDLLQYLPEPLRPETLMCYLGTHDTYTPAHKDLCGSVGHNLMVDTESAGSSFWFMTKTSDAHDAAQYLQTLGYELDHENHALTLEELANAPFDVYVTEQRKGDLILVPPSSMHQVVNQGGITLKVSWSRMTPRSLEIAIEQELDIYRRVCRREVYRCKLTAYTAVKQITALMGAQNNLCDGTSSDNTLIRDLQRCLEVYEKILITEWSSQSYPPPTEDIGPLNDQSASDDISLRCHRTCDFCDADIFNAFFSCNNTECSSYQRNGHVDLCPGCYAEGRSCSCGNMVINQLQSFEKLLKVRDDGRSILKDQLPGYSFPAKDTDASWLKSKAQLCTFEAACTLHRGSVVTRKTAEMRSCRAPKYYRDSGDSHTVPTRWWVRCDKCHAGYCFPHLLERGRKHSVEILLHLHKIHDLHKAAESPLVGIQPNNGDAKVYLAQVAGHYALSMRSVDLSGKHLKCGFYDNFKPQAKVDPGASSSVVSSGRQSRKVIDPFREEPELSAKGDNEEETDEEVVDYQSDTSYNSSYSKGKRSLYVTRHPRSASKNVRRIVKRLQDQDEDGNRISKKRRYSKSVLPLKVEGEDGDGSEKEEEDPSELIPKIPISQMKFVKKTAKVAPTLIMPKPSPKPKLKSAKSEHIIAKPRRLAPPSQPANISSPTSNPISVLVNSDRTMNTESSHQAISKQLAHSATSGTTGSQATTIETSASDQKRREIDSEILCLKNNCAKLEKELEEERSARKQIEETYERRFLVMEESIRNLMEAQAREREIRERERERVEPKQAPSPNFRPYHAGPSTFSRAPNRGFGNQFRGGNQFYPRGHHSQYTPHTAYSTPPRAPASYYNRDPNYHDRR